MVLTGYPSLQDALDPHPFLQSQIKHQICAYASLSLSSATTKRPTIGVKETGCHCNCNVQDFFNAPRLSSEKITGGDMIEVDSRGPDHTTMKTFCNVQERKTPRLLFDMP